jgi:hypothetical protein
VPVEPLDDDAVEVAGGGVELVVGVLAGVLVEVEPEEPVEPVPVPLLELPLPIAVVSEPLST